MAPNQFALVVAAFALLAGGANAQAAEEAAVVTLATGKTWVCNQEGIVQWPANDAFPADMLVSLFLTSPTLGQVKLGDQAFTHGDQSAVVTLDCEIVGLAVGNSDEYAIAVAAGSEDNVVAVSASFWIDNLGLVQPSMGSTLSFTKSFNLTWVSAFADPEPASVEVFGRPATGEPVLIALLADGVAVDTVTALTLPTKSSAFPAVFLRLTAGEDAVDSSDYALATAKASLEALPSAETNICGLCIFTIWRIVSSLARLGNAAAYDWYYYYY